MAWSRGTDSVDEARSRFNSNACFLGGGSSSFRVRSRIGRSVFMFAESWVVVSVKPKSLGYR
jgi:hypothetical protein